MQNYHGTSPNYRPLEKPEVLSEIEALLKVSGVAAYLPKEVRRLDVPSTHAHRVPTVTIPELKTYGIW